MNATFDNCSVEREGDRPVRVHWFCTHEAMQRIDPPGTQSDHLHPDVVKQVSEHVMYLPAHGADALNALINSVRDARDEWCGLQHVPCELWLDRKRELDDHLSRLEQQRTSIRVVRVVLATPEDLFINVCQHGPDRKLDRSCSVGLRVAPESLSDFGGALPASVQYG